MSRVGGRVGVLAVCGAIAAVSCGDSATEGAKDGSTVDAPRVEAGRIDALARDAAARDATGPRDARSSTPDSSTRDATKDVAIDSDLDGSHTDAKDGGADTGVPHDAATDADDAALRDAGADGSATGTCQTCVAQACETLLMTCAEGAAPMCMNWLQCINACITGDDPASCYTACDSQYPSAEAAYEPVYQCVCASCNAACPAANACTH